MQTTQTTQQFKSWINDASPDDLLTIGQSVVSRIGSLDQVHRDRFTKAVQNDTYASKLFNQQPA